MGIGSVNHDVHGEMRLGLFSGQYVVALWRQDAVRSQGRSRVRLGSVSEVVDCDIRGVVML